MTSTSSYMWQWVGESQGNRGMVSRGFTGDKNNNTTEYLSKVAPHMKQQLERRSAIIIKIWYACTGEYTDKNADSIFRGRTESLETIPIFPCSPKLLYAQYIHNGSHQAGIQITTYASLLPAINWLNLVFLSYTANRGEKWKAEKATRLKLIRCEKRTQYGFLLLVEKVVIIHGVIFMSEPWGIRAVCRGTSSRQKGR